MLQFFIPWLTLYYAWRLYRHDGEPVEAANLAKFGSVTLSISVLVTFSLYLILLHIQLYNRFFSSDLAIQQTKITNTESKLFNYIKMQPQMKSKEVHDNLVESDMIFDSFTEKVNQMEASVREGDVNPEQLLPLMASLKKSNMIKKRGEYMGLEIFVNRNNARKELPYKAPE